MLKKIKKHACVSLELSREDFFLKRTASVFFKIFFKQEAHRPDGHLSTVNGMFPFSHILIIRYRDKCMNCVLITIIIYFSSEIYLYFSMYFKDEFIVLCNRMVHFHKIYDLKYPNTLNFLKFVLIIKYYWYIQLLKYTRH